MPQTKQDLVARLTALKTAVSGYQYADMQSLPDDQYTAAKYGYYLANTAARLINDGLECLGQDDPITLLNKRLGGQTAGRITINSLGQVEPERTPVDPNSPEALHIAASFIAIVEVVVAGIERGLPAIDREKAIENALATVTANASVHEAISSDPYVQAIYWAARKFSNGSVEDLVAIGAVEPPPPVTEIVIGGEPKEGDKKLTFYIPLPAAQPAEKVGPLTYQAGLAAAVTEAELA
jgi:hypothetical protein